MTPPASERLLRYFLANGLARPDARPTVLLRLRPLPKLAEWRSRVWRDFSDDGQPTVADVTDQVLALFQAMGDVPSDDVPRMRLWVDPKANYRFSLTTKSALPPSPTAIDVGSGWYYAVNRGDLALLDDLECQHTQSYSHSRAQHV